MVASITAITIPHLARTIAAVGGDPAAVLGDLRSDARFEDRIPVATLIELWERAIATTGHRALPGIASSYAEPDERSLISFVVANQPRLGDGIDRFQRYASTVSDAYCWTLVDDGADLRMVLSPTGPIHRLGWQCHLEFEILDIVRSVARLTGGLARPRSLAFLHAPPPSDVLDAYAQLAGLTPAFGQDRGEVIFPIAIRELAVPNARPALARVVETQLEALLDAIRRGAAVSTRARGAIGELLARGSIGVDELARALAMSRRSLERALADEDTSAAALIEDERKQRALAWLPALSVDEVAARLAYSDARAFARAFKRWTGIAPSQARTRAP